LLPPSGEAENGALTVTSSTKAIVRGWRRPAWVKPEKFDIGWKRKVM